ncbi:MAG: NADPH-dependent FMN reductase [Gammaproteobacteria bacterium]|nr:NADPH-dependent FMN reductase [Gammaproteobacteria bacterium]MBK80598.1 NADPH-dependent FMN reductase [Gammaproteobacteria bacterium]|tara:strand:+ start:1143 stop:1694 length:552 start_codon:yes stop_codon:yes gene_type:complete
MITILGIPGSLRRGSTNRALLESAGELMPEGARLEVAGLDGIPLYDGDLEAAEGIPPAVAALKDRIAAADGVVIATPEYNGSMPGVLKNAVDWCSRPPEDQARVLRDRPVAMLGATPGRLGTILAQDAWLGVVRTLRMRPWYQGRLMVSGVHELLDDQGRLTDARTREQLREFMAGFVAFVRG